MLGALLRYTQYFAIQISAIDYNFRAQRFVEAICVFLRAAKVACETCKTFGLSAKTLTVFHIVHGYYVVP